MTIKTHRQVETTSRLLRNFAWGLIATLVVMGIFGKRGWLDLRRMERENSNLKAEIMELQEENEQMSRDIHAFQSDPSVQEAMIRKVLGYIKRDEKIIEF
ncbi:septum formation initiator family protein [bacterium]|nr:septum formation initiator family protein [bacterium]